MIRQLSHTARFSAVCCVISSIQHLDISCINERANVHFKKITFCIHIRALDIPHFRESKLSGPSLPFWFVVLKRLCPAHWHRLCSQFVLQAAPSPCSLAEIVEGPGAVELGPRVTSQGTGSDATIADDASIRRSAHFGALNFRPSGPMGDFSSVRA